MTRPVARCIVLTDDGAQAFTSALATYDGTATGTGTTTTPAPTAPTTGTLDFSDPLNSGHI